MPKKLGGEKMKHITILLLAITLVLFLGACNSKTSQDTNTTANAHAPTTQTTEESPTSGGSTAQNGGIAEEADSPSDGEGSSSVHGGSTTGTHENNSNSTTNGNGVAVEASNGNTAQTDDSDTTAGNGVTTGGTVEDDNTLNNDGTTHTSSGGEDTTDDNANNTAGGSSTGSNTDANIGSAEHNTTGDGNSTTSGGESDDNTTTDGNDDNPTAGGGDDNTTTTPTVTLAYLKLTVDKTSLNKDENTTVKVMATYSDNTSKEVTDKVEWVVVPSDAVKMTNATLTALQDKATTVKAKLKGKTSNAITLNITWTVNGHTLPPEPDKALNDATLLGIDVNDNGVRDDVERWIYEKYDKYIPCHQELDWNNTVVIDGETIPSAVQVCEENPVPYHPVVRAVAMQGAKAAQIIIQEPEKARETTVYEDNAQDCEFYLDRISKENNDSSIGAQNFQIEEFNKVQYNTIQRARAYAKYNFYLSGGIYGVPATAEEELKGCNKEVKALLKDLK